MGCTEGHLMEVMVDVGIRTVAICSVRGHESLANPFGLKRWSAELPCS